MAVCLGNIREANRHRRRVKDAKGGKKEYGVLYVQRASKVWSGRDVWEEGHNWGGCTGRER